MWRWRTIWSIKNDNSFRLETASAQLDVFNECEASEGAKRDSSLSVLVHRERCASKSPDACPWQVDCARMTVQVESEIREKVRELYERTGEIAA